jgi:hypothetical protein
MKKNTIFFKVGVSLIALLAVQGCTDLDEKTYSTVIDTKFGGNSDQLSALIGPLYGGLGDYYGTFSSLNATTDEQIVPTRGGDWKDGDQWKRYEMHTWSPALDDGAFNGIWNYCYSNVAKINQQIVNAAISSDPKAKSELRTLRAFYHYIALDNFGNAIIVLEQDPTAISSESTALPSQSTPKQIYDFVEKELTESLPNLSDVAGGENYGRMTSWVAHMILAKMYLNHKTYLGTEDKAIYQKAWDHANAIIVGGKFSLAADFFSNFTVNNQGSPEIILATPMDKTKRTGFNTQFSTLHYKHQLTYDLGAAPWNGFATAAEFYNSFDDADVRKKGWIVGQQFDIAGNPLKDDDLDMIIDPVIPAFEMPAGAFGRLKGARSQKYEIQLHNHTSGNSQDNDFLIYRLADVYMMRGEAAARIAGAATAATVDDFNQIRSLRNVPLYTAGTLTWDEMLAERGRELAWEFHRRQDQIRFGTYDAAYGFKPATDPYHKFYPIPQSQINLNPNLHQNPGY